MGTREVVVAIDPGVSGAIALIDKRYGRMSVWDMPVAIIEGRRKRRVVDDKALALLLYQQVPKDVTGAIEQVNAHPGEGVASAFSFGRSYGVARGVMCGLGIEFVDVLPVQWKRFQGLLKKQKEDSRLLALEKYPQMKAALGLKKHNGRAEALLIADYVMRG
jgi:crossover junction endodeoxyribonuclease RuvC